MAEQRVEADRSTGRLVVTLVAYLGLFLFAYTVPLASPAKGVIAPSLGLATEADTWPLFTTYFLSWLFVVPSGAYMADRFGRKALLMAGSALLATGMLLFSVSDTLLLACVAQFLNGAGAILLQVVGIAVVTDLYAERRGSSLSLAVGLVGIVALLSPLLMGELLGRGVAWQSVYRYSAILPLAALALQAVSRFPRAPGAEHITLAVVRDLLRSPLFLLLILSMLVYAIVEQGIPIWAASYVGQDLGASVRVQGLVVSGYFVIMSVARALVGLAGGLDRRPYPAVVVGSAVLGAACLALGTLPNNLVMAAIFLPLSGAAIAMIWPSIMTYAVQETGKPTTVVFGLVVGIGGSLGAAFGAGALGRIKQMGLTYQQSLLTLEIPLVALLVIFGLIYLRRREAPKPAPAPVPVAVEAEAGSAPL